MATYKGVNRTKITSEPIQAIPKGEQYGRLHVAYDEYTAAGALALNDVIELMTLPEGARVHEVILDSSDLGTTGTLDLGWAAGAKGLEAANATGFFSAVDVATAATRVSLVSNGAQNAAGYLKKFAEEVLVQINVSAATTAGGTIRVTVLYTVD
ncbi:hypothetical protein D6745_03225 [Candidatus Woesearchaeota archaeon]|nr:MAG: hypothetical protein D6745_03225 [Candidatus Woesearchaeota archaeon]